MKCDKQPCTPTDKLQPKITLRFFIMYIWPASVISVTNFRIGGKGRDLVVLGRFRWKGQILGKCGANKIPGKGVRILIQRLVNHATRWTMFNVKVYTDEVVKQFKFINRTHARTPPPTHKNKPSPTTFCRTHKRFASRKRQSLTFRGKNF